MRRLVLFCFLSLIALTHSAQCPIKNTAFVAGESLSYDLYFNWKFVWLYAGTANLSTSATQWENQPALKSYLISRTSSKLDKFFMMRDTLQSIITPNLCPLYYKKAANEGGKLYIDQVWYSYANGKTLLKQQFQDREGKITNRTNSNNKCVYDMYSMLLRTRSLSPNGLKKGDKIKFLMADGNKVEESTLIFRGRENCKMRNSDTTYRCLVLSFVEYNKEGVEKEVITFYVTDDDNHIPVRLDMYLNFGTAKAFLKDMKGLRSESTAKVR